VESAKGPSIYGASAADDPFDRGAECAKSVPVIAHALGAATADCVAGAGACRIFKAGNPLPKRKTARL